MIVCYLVTNIFLIFFILILFYQVSKLEKWDIFSSSTFECGFSSYFFSRFSFSVHYFMVGLIFLLLDLEFCMIMPFFNEVSAELILNGLMMLFVMMLILGLIMEWKEGKLDWKF